MSFYSSVLYTEAMHYVQFFKELMDISNFSQWHLNSATAGLRHFPKDSMDCKRNSYKALLQTTVTEQRQTLNLSSIMFPSYL